MNQNAGFIDTLAGKDNAALSKVAVPAETILPFRTAAELTCEQPIAPLWFVPGFVAPGVVIEFDGKLKASGKTTFVAWMVKAMLQGQDFMGRPTRRTAAVWLTEERAPSFLETLKRAQLTDEQTSISCVGTTLNGWLGGRSCARR